MSFTSISHALQSFLSSDLAVRNGAEEFLNSIPEKDFLGGIQQYLSALDLPQAELTELAALLLKKQYIDKDANLQKIPEDVIVQIVTKVEATITETRKILYIKRACEILVKLYTLKDGISQLMGLIQKFSVASASNLKIGLMYLIEIVCEFSFNDEDLLKHSTEICAIFEKFLGDAETTVRAATFKSLTGFLCSIEEIEHLKKFEGVLPTLISKCIECLQADEESGSTSLGSLVDLVEIHPAFVKKIAAELVNLFTEIISSNSMAENIRIKGLSGVLAISASLPAIVKKTDVFKNKTVPALMKMMTEADTLSLEEWTEELDDEALSKNDPASAASETLAKIGYEVTNKFLLPLFIPLIKEALANSQWNIQFAGLSAIAQLVEGCKDSFVKDLPSIVAMVQSQEGSTNPRIQYGILTAYSLLCTEFTPEIQTNHGKVILETILKNMSSDNLKLKYRSVQAIINFCKELIENDEDCEILKTYADKLLAGISQIFEQSLTAGQQRILEETLICLSTLAITLESEFSKYYSSFMPGLQQLISTMPATTPTQISIRVHTIECMGYLLTSVSKTPEIFNRDQDIIMNALLSMQSDAKIEKDDPHHPPILVVYGQIAETMKEGFAKYLPAVANRVIQSAQIAIDAVTEDAISNTPSQDYDKTKIAKVNFDLGLFGGLKTLQLNTAALEQKIEAFHTLFNIANSTKTAFLPYVEASLPIVMEHISFKNSRDISETAIKTIKCLMNACGTDQQKLATIFNLAIPQLSQLLSNSVSQSHSEDIYILVVNIAECIKALVSGEGINKEIVEKAIQLSSQALAVCATLKKSVIKEFAKEDMDEETQEQFDEQYDDANQIMAGMIDFIAQTVRVFPALENTVVNSLLPDFYNVFTKDSGSDNELNVTLCVFAELFSYCSQPIFDRAYPEMVRKFIDYSKDYQNLNIKQSSVFGIGLVAKRTTTAQFSPYLEESLKVLSTLLTSAELQEEDSETVKENVVASLIKIALYQVQDANIRAEIFAKCLPCLPLKADTEEAQNLHELLVKLGKEQYQPLIENPATLALLTEAFARVKAYFQSKPDSEILKQSTFAQLQ